MKKLAVLMVLSLGLMSWANAQVRDVVIRNRVFNDDPNSISSHVKALPHITLSDTRVMGDGVAPDFANRHAWYVSSDGVSELQIPIDDCQLDFSLTLTGTPIAPRKEAGFIIKIGMPWGHSEGQFIVNTDAREVVAFGYPFPFYRFTGISYNSGDTLYMAVRLFKDTADGRYKVIYTAGSSSSPALALADQALITGWITPGGYLQVQIQAGNPLNGGVAVFNNIRWNGVLLRSLFNISGNIQLRDYGGDVTRVPVAAELRVQGGPVHTQTLYTDSAGDYVIRDVEPGTYDVAFKASHWLRVVVPDVTVVNADVTGVNAALTNGDIDGDNEVTLFDFGRLVAAFGSVPGDSNWDADADLDGDEEVTLFDFGVLVRNFGAIGDE